KNKVEITSTNPNRELTIFLITAHSLRICAEITYFSLTKQIRSMSQGGRQACRLGLAFQLTSIGFGHSHTTNAIGSFLLHQIRYSIIHSIPPVPNLALSAAWLKRIFVTEIAFLHLFVFG